MDLARENLKSLLGYAEEILKSNDHAIANLDKDAIDVFYEENITNIDGIFLPKGDTNDWWLRLARVTETDAPKPNDEYLPWLETKKKSKSFTEQIEKPKLLDNLMITATAEEASELVEAGIVTNDDIMRQKNAINKKREESIESDDETEDDGDYNEWSNKQENIVFNKKEEQEVYDIIIYKKNIPEFVDNFENWLEKTWGKWAEKEKNRRASISLYRKLFDFYQQTSTMRSDTDIEVVMGIGMARWEHPSGKINIPLIEALVEIEFDQESGTIDIIPRDQTPTLALRAFDEYEARGTNKIAKEAGEILLRTWNDPDVIFSPHNKASFEQVLRACQSRLTSDAVYIPDETDGDNRNLPPIDEKLRISDTWVIYVRERSINFRCDDIHQLKSAIETISDKDFPNSARNLVRPPEEAGEKKAKIDLTSNSLINHGEQGGASPFDGRKEENETFFFPLPYNEEQISIVKRLSRPDTYGVVVQGPPGTGKTHTIANIISHYMATGKRVLVSTYSSEALSAIQSKLPESIRDLTIAVVHSDREGAKHLEQAIGMLSSEIKEIDVDKFNRQRIELERDLAATQDSMDIILGELEKINHKNFSEVAFDGKHMMPVEVVKRTKENADQYKWFTDNIDIDDAYEPKFDDATIEEIQKIRDKLGEDISYSLENLPEAKNLPIKSKIMEIHAALKKEQNILKRVNSGLLPRIHLTKENRNDAIHLYKWIKSATKWKSSLKGEFHWIWKAHEALVGIQGLDNEKRGLLRHLLEEWYELAIKTKKRAIKYIKIPPVRGENEALLDKAINLLADGKKPFGAFAFGASVSATKLAIETITIDGEKPGTSKSWGLVREFRKWTKDVDKFFTRWRDCAKILGLPEQFTSNMNISEFVTNVGERIKIMGDIHKETRQCIAEAQKLFPYGISAKKVILEINGDDINELIVFALNEGVYREAKAIKNNMSELSKEKPLPFYADIANCADMMGADNVSSEEMDNTWEYILAEANRLNKLRQFRERLELLVERIKDSGGINWAASLLSQPSIENDPLTSRQWRQAWEWARGKGYVKVLSTREHVEMLKERHRRLENHKENVMGELVRIRTFIGLKQNITGTISSALQQFAMHVRLLGAGTGKSAERRRRAIRESTIAAAGAVPCWILPEWRVAEQLPSELGLFDLVIIDEASQSNITSLPILLRGKKLLVVGDDKQVSPSAVGMEERVVVQLRETYLKGTAAENFLEPTTSLYDFASIIFPESVIMLREHFRCVPEIIGFSNRFYAKDLIPMRMATKDTVITPPLRDVYLPEGLKKNDKNKAEAKYIVSEIKRLTSDEKYKNRPIGVISLIGDKQARDIYGMLMDEIGTAAIARHRIMCGNASTYQGQERDIIFLSMVASPNGVRAQTAKLMEQRYNVAMSRARDCVYLVRSVAQSQLKNDDLKSMLIEHFQNPTAYTTKKSNQNIFEETESWFEQDVGEELIKLGYRIKPQVKIGTYRIDFVVEGEGDRRLAIELDGDRYHGPDQWHDDLVRQRSLERLGWVFWRCFASHWASDRKDCLNSLIDKLNELGIERLGNDNIKQTKHTEHLVIRSEDYHKYGMDEITDEDSGTAKSGPTKDSIVEIGDFVVIRFNDENKSQRIKLTNNDNTRKGEINHKHPIGAAILGASKEDEVEVEIEGELRKILIEDFFKPEQSKSNKSNYQK